MNLILKKKTNGVGGDCIALSELINQSICINCVFFKWNDYEYCTPNFIYSKQAKTKADRFYSLSCVLPSGIVIYLCYFILFLQIINFIIIICLEGFVET